MSFNCQRPLEYILTRISSYLFVFHETLTLVQEYAIRIQMSSLDLDMKLVFSEDQSTEGHGKDLPKLREVFYNVFSLRFPVFILLTSSL